MSENLFIHIPKTGGTTICHALGLIKSHWTLELQIEAGGEPDGEVWCVCRDPRSWMVSWYHFLRGTQNNPRSAADLAGSMTCSEWVTRVLDEPEAHTIHSGSAFRPQHEYVTVNGEMRADRVCRFENYREEVGLQIVRCGGDPSVLDRVRKNSTGRKDWREHLTDEARRRIEEHYDDDFRIFGYETDDV